ncbi:MAG: cupin domain-containing protein, partial [Ruminococcus sp.]
NSKTERTDYMYGRNEKRSKDAGPAPYAVKLRQETLRNDNFRTALWTGANLQLTLMSIPPGGEIGLENHPDTDQFLRLEQGKALVKMGSCKGKLTYQKCICAGDAVFVPAGTWHNIINKGRCPLKLYSIYAPPKHPHGTVDVTNPEH